MISQEKFEEYLCNIVTEKTAHRYSKAINDISDVMIEHHVIYYNLYSYQNIETLIKDIEKMSNNTIFIEMEHKTHNLYSCSLKHFKNYFEENIKKS